MLQRHRQVGVLGTVFMKENYNLLGEVFITKECMCVYMCVYWDMGVHVYTLNNVYINVYL